MSTSYEEECGKFIDEHGEQILTALRHVTQGFRELSENPNENQVVRDLGLNAARQWQAIHDQAEALVEWEEDVVLFTNCLVCGSSTPHRPHSAPLTSKIIGQHMEGDHSDCAVEACESAAALARTQASEAGDV